MLNYIKYLKNYQHEDTINLKMNFDESLASLQNLYFQELKNTYKSLNNQTTYLRNFMEIFEPLLLFNWATSQQFLIVVIFP